ncbi:epoxyqueuosine reductase QueH [bacterium]
MEKTSRPTLLLHACCAPCTPHVINLLRENFRVTVFFYNPNIHPEEEYRKRESEIREFSEKEKFSLIVGEYDVSNWMEAMKGLESEPEGGERCRICFRMRLERAAREAEERGIEYITTTLSVSPHKNIKLINEEGNRAAGKCGIKFREENFKKKDGFRISCDLAAEHGMYRQDYCGCVFSQK